MQRRILILSAQRVERLRRSDRGQFFVARKIYGANCWPGCHFEREGRKCSRKKLWRPDVSGVGGGARDFFRKLTVNDRVNLRSECGGTIPFDRCASYVAPPLKERKNGNLNDLRHARLSRILIGGEDKGESCTKS